MRGESQHAYPLTPALSKRERAGVRGKASTSIRTAFYWISTTLGITAEDVRPPTPTLSPIGGEGRVRGPACGGVGRLGSNAGRGGIFWFTAAQTAGRLSPSPRPSPPMGEREPRVADERLWLGSPTQNSEEAPCSCQKLGFALSAPFRGHPISEFGISSCGLGGGGRSGA